MQWFKSTKLPALAAGTLLLVACAKSPHLADGQNGGLNANLEKIFDQVLKNTKDEQSNYF